MPSPSYQHPAAPQHCSNPLGLPLLLMGAQAGAALYWQRKTTDTSRPAALIIGAGDSRTMVARTERQQEQHYLVYDTTPMKTPPCWAARGVPDNPEVVDPAGLTGGHRSPGRGVRHQGNCGYLPRHKAELDTARHVPDH